MKPLLFILAGLVILAGTPVLPVPVTPWTWPVPVVDPYDPDDPDDPVSPDTVTAAVYVYEKDDGPVPVGVSAGIDKLNREKKLTASLFEKDTVDGTGQVPGQYRPALDAAKAKAIPSLVVLAGTNAIKVVEKPKTQEDIIGAVK